MVRQSPRKEALGMRKMFKDFHEAWSFCTGKEGAAVRVCGDEWEVTWTGEKAAPEPPSAFERIVSRNGGEDAPEELVQRHKVVGIVETPLHTDASEEYTVSLRPVLGAYRDIRLFGVSEEQAQLFKVGTEIQVVLRPAPLA